MDQTDLGDRFAVLMISVRRGDRSLPLVWRIEEGEANIGFAGQQVLLEEVRAWLPEGAAVMLLGVSVMVEMVYHIKLNEVLGPLMTYRGFELDTHATQTWVTASVVTGVGILIFEVVRRKFVLIWSQIQEAIEAEIRRRESH